MLSGRVTAQSEPRLREASRDWLASSSPPMATASSVSPEVPTSISSFDACQFLSECGYRSLCSFPLVAFIISESTISKSGFAVSHFGATVQRPKREVMGDEQLFCLVAFNLVVFGGAELTGRCRRRSRRKNDEVNSSPTGSAFPHHCVQGRVSQAGMKLVYKGST